MTIFQMNRTNSRLRHIRRRRNNRFSNGEGDRVRTGEIHRENGGGESSLWNLV
ncbi:MAG: hypothetical protein ACOX60_11195 [Massiliimalia sp.]